MKSRFSVGRSISLFSLFVLSGVSSLAVDQTQTASLKGRVFRSDTNEPIPNAVIVLLDEKKSAKQDNSVETKTNDQGNYAISNIAAGKYTLSIRAWYKTQTEAPCQLLMGKTIDKDSTVIVARDNDKFVQQLVIKGFPIRRGKEMVKDFDIVCSSIFEK